MELEAVHSAARHAEGMMQRDAQAPLLAELPSQKDQGKHCLTHVPYMNLGALLALLSGLEQIDI